MPVDLCLTRLEISNRYLCLKTHIICALAHECLIAFSSLSFRFDTGQTPLRFGAHFKVAGDEAGEKEGYHDKAL